MRKIHVVLAGKGGIGKTFVASLIAQAIQERGEPLVCFDADPVNASLNEIRGLHTEPLNLFLPDSDEADLDALDRMVERFLTEDATIVVDNGAASFLPLSRYLLQDGIAETLKGAGKSLVLHTLIAGGGELTQTVRGFDSIASQFPAEIPLVLWLNPYHGAIIGADGAAFEDTPVYKKHRARIDALFHLPQLDRLSLKSLGAMTSRRMTFVEAAESNLFVMDKQRLLQIKRPIFEQLAAVL
jgi:hypothetical protein